MIPENHKPRRAERVASWLREFPDRYGNTFKVYMMVVLELSLLGVAGLVIMAQASQIHQFKSAMEIRSSDLRILSRSERVRNLLLHDIAVKSGVPKDKVRVILRLDPIAPIRDPDMPPEQIINSSGSQR